MKLGCIKKYSKVIHFVILLSVFFVFGCANKTSFTEVKIDDQYSIQLPSFLERTTKLHKDASLQYENLEKEFYVVVIDENKNELRQYNLNFTLASYLDSVKKQVVNNGLTDAIVSAGKEMRLDNCNALVGEITGKGSKEEVFYKFAVIESNEHFYQVITWTLKECSEKYSSVMDSVIFSLSELH